MGAGVRTDYRKVAVLAALIVAIAALWNTWAVYPLRLLVVFFHELSHGVAAMLTGGAIVEIRMNAREGGQCLTRGGVPFIVISAGYLGSLVWGGAILLLSTRTKPSPIIIELLGVLLLIVTLVWVRPVLGFGFGFGLLAGLVLVAMAYFFKPVVHETLLAAIGLTSVLYAVLDIKSDILDRPHAISDAVLLAEHTGIPAIVWGLLWFGVSMALAVRFIIAAGRRDTGIIMSPTPRP